MKHREIDLSKEKINNVTSEQVTEGQKTKKDVNKVRSRINAENQNRYRNKKPPPDITHKTYYKIYKKACKCLEKQHYEHAHRLFQNIVVQIKKEDINNLNFIEGIEVSGEEIMIKCFENINTCNIKILEKNLSSHSYIFHTEVFISTVDKFVSRIPEIGNKIKKTEWYKNVLQKHNESLNNVK